MFGEGRVHAVTVGLAQDTVGVTPPNGVRVLRDSLLGLGLLAGAGDLGGLGLPTVHTAVRRTHEGTIAAWRTLPRNPLARLLATSLGPQLVELQAEISNFSKEGVHFV